MIEARDAIPRISLLWLLAALLLLIVPHVVRLPVWVTVLLFSCMGWRLLIYAGRLGFPGKLLKISIVLVALPLTVMQYGAAGEGLDTAVCLLILGVVFKLLEMRDRRDILIVIALCYVLAMLGFIYTQTILATLHAIVCFILITATMLSLYRDDARNTFKDNGRLAVRLVLQSIPLTIALFVLVPRVSPLWSMPLPVSSSTSTGVSDEMTPGDITNLGRSTELAFRVSFTGDAPANEALYWRGLVLDFFDGRTWRRAGSTLQTYQMISRFPTDFRGVPLGEPVSYDVIMEPTQQSWVYSLQLAEVSARDMVQDRNYSLITEMPINQRYRYQVNSYLQHQTDLQLAGTQRARSLQMPEGDLNPRTSALATQMRAAAATDIDFAMAVLQHFRELPFYYTLTPSALGDSSIDEFMFTTREGFCGHYAGSFVYMMREVGIPARVVVGYQGGEYNPYEDYTLVYQYNAHAWAEVWIEGEGWVRFDPTAAVAPERITLGVETFFQDQPGFMEDAGFSMMRFRDTQWLNTVRLRLEGLDYAWNRWVVSYDENMQMELLGNWFGDNARRGLLIALGSTIAMFFVLAGWFLLRHGKVTRHDPATRLYLNLLKELARSGVPRQRGEGPVDYCSRVAAQRPEIAMQMSEVTDLFLKLAYVNKVNMETLQNGSNADFRRLRLTCRQLRRRLMTPLRRLLAGARLVP